MKHLFIINPAAGWVKRNKTVLERQLRAFLRTHAEIRYDVYETKWCRDAVGYTRAYIMDMFGAGGNDHLRIHVMGGLGTLYEVINAVIGVPNVSVAAYPFGSDNGFLRYFGSKKPFASIEKQVFSKTIPIDVIRCGNSVGINASQIGALADANRNCGGMTEIGLPFNLSYSLSMMKSTFVCPSWQLLVELDGQRLDGEYIAVSVANGPCLGTSYCPSPHAHPDDGLLDFYFVHKLAKWKVITYLEYFLTGQHDKAPSGLLSHYKGKKLTVSSKQSLNMCIDGENFAGTVFDYEILSHAINFVCPDGVELNRLPLVFNRRKEGFRK